MRRADVWMVITATLVLAVSAYSWRYASEMRPDRLPVAAVTLQAAEGPVSLTDWPGSLVVVVIGYTHCPDICPMSLASFAQAIAQLTPGDQARVKGVFISVDPQRDTPAHLADYVTYFSPRLRGVTGSYEQLQQVVQRFGTDFKTPGLGGEPVSASPHYTVTHPTNFYLLDPDARLLAVLPAHTTAAQLATRLRQELELL